MANLNNVKFKTNNGIVLRTIAILFGISWFKGLELKNALNSYNLEMTELCECLSYFEDREYIKTRAIEGGNEASISECDLKDLKFKLAAEGKLVVKSYKQDIAIEI